MKLKTVSTVRIGTELCINIEFVSSEPRMTHYPSVHHKSSYINRQYVTIDSFHRRAVEKVGMGSFRPSIQQTSEVEMSNTVSLRSYYETSHHLIRRNYPVKQRGCGDNPLNTSRSIGIMMFLRKISQ